MDYRDMSQSDNDLAQNLLDAVVVPRPPEPVKSDITPVEAFITAAGKDIPALMIFCFGVNAAITGYTWLLPALHKYLSNYDATYDYDVDPYGQNTTKSYADADAKKDANRLNDEFKEGDLTTALIVTMSLFGGIALASVVFNAVMLGLLHFAGIIDLRNPMSDKTQRQDRNANSVESVYLWIYYLDLNPTLEGLLTTSMRSLLNFAKRFTPIAEYFYNPLAVGATSSLTSSLILAVILGYYVQQEFNGFYDDKHEELVAGFNCKSDDEALACKAQAYEYAVDSVINYLFKDVLDNSAVQVLAWMPVVLLAVMPVASFINRAVFGDKMKWILAFVKDAGQDVPYLLVLSFALMLALSGPFALQLGKEDYDADYDQLHDSGLSTSPETFAASGAANLFAGHYTYGKLLTYFVNIQTGLFALMAGSVSFRSLRSFIAHNAGVIDVCRLNTTEAQDRALAQQTVENSNNQDRLFYGPYTNYAYSEDSGVRNTFAHRLYTIPAEFTPSSAWRIYYPMVIGVMTTLLVSALLSVMSWVVAQDKFWKYFDEKFDPLNDNGNCETSAEDRDCRSNAARDGIIYGLKELMSTANKDDVLSMVWSTVAVMAAVYVANGLYNLYNFATTPRAADVRNSGVGFDLVSNPLSRIGMYASRSPYDGLRQSSESSSISDFEESSGHGSVSPSTGSGRNSE